MEQKKFEHLFEALAEDQAASPMRDAWPAIKRKLQARQGQDERTLMINKQWKALQKLAYGLAVIPILALFLMFTPQGQAFAQSIQRFFTKTETNQVEISLEKPVLSDQSENAPDQTLQAAEQVVSAPKDCRESLTPACSVEVVEADLGYELKLPGYLPENMKFEGAKLEDSGALVSFTSPEGALYLTQAPLSSAQQTWPVGRDAEIRAVKVNGRAAEYTEGFWSSGKDSGSMQWASNDAIQSLAWEDENARYRLIGLAGKVQDSMRLGWQEMVKIAESLSPEVVVDIAVKPDDGVSAAEEKAGFQFDPLPFIPDGFGLARTVYNPEFPAICQYWEQTKSPGWDLILAQWKGQVASTDQIYRDENINGQIVKIPMEVRNISLRGAVNETATYFSNGLVTDVICGGEPNRANQAIMWQKGEKSFMLFGPIDSLRGQGYVTEGELVRMAELINGLPEEIVLKDTLDPGRITSLQDAQSLFPEPLAFPRQMMEGYHLDHFRYDESKQGNEAYLTTLFIRKPNIEFLVISQVSGGNNLEQEIAEANKLSIWGAPGHYGTACTEAPLGGEKSCSTWASWRSGNSSYDFMLQSEEAIEKETILSILETMKP